MDVQRSSLKIFFLSTLLIISSACSSTPKNLTPASDTAKLPLVKIKDPPEPKVAPDNWQVYESEEKTREEPKPKIKTKNNVKANKTPSPVPSPAPTRAFTGRNDPSLVFDIPVAYNPRVKYWVGYFQTSGRSWYIKWLERSPRYLPILQKTLARHGLPRDLAYMAMIESGFSSQASSAAKAVGPWQFIRETGERYGLKVAWWIDERRDMQKSTDAASKYLKKLYGMFHNWYLVAASYNTGENRIKHQIARHGTKNFWQMANLDSETRDYVPKLIAALLIAKSPEMYGFHNIKYNLPLEFEHFRAPGGTRLDELSQAIGVNIKVMRDLNPELTRDYIPNYISGHMIRIPKGSAQLVSLYFRRTFVSER
jgi:membrane-bound lytic murein transglycosylase D